MLDFVRRRDEMVATQLAARGIVDPRVLAAMREVPHEAFVPDRLSEVAYEDGPLPIGEGQTISQPYMVALMIQAAAVAPGDRVLDIGTGSGYAAAVLSRIAGRVYGIERLGGLVAAAQERFARLGYDRIALREGDGTLGWPEEAPFDAILVAAGGPVVPEPLKRQVTVGGRIVLPVGPSRCTQTLVRLRRTGEESFEQTDLGLCAFVPLRGAHGWPEPHPSGPGRDAVPPAAGGEGRG